MLVFCASPKGTELIESSNSLIIAEVPHSLKFCWETKGFPLPQKARSLLYEIDTGASDRFRGLILAGIKESYRRDKQTIRRLKMARGSYLAGIMRSCILAVGALGGMGLPVYAASDITIGGSATLTTDYVFRGITQTAGNPAIQGEFDLTYSVKQFPNLFYFTIWSSNLDFGGGPQGQEIAPIEIDWDAGIRPTWGKWTFDIGSLYYSYPGSCNSVCTHAALGIGSIPYWELKTGVSRNFFSDKLALSLTNYWSPDNAGSTGNNDVLEFDYGWTFNKVWYFTPNIGGVVGRQWGTQSAGGFDYTYWNVGLNLAFNNKPALALDLRYWDTSHPDVCPDSVSGVFACGARIVGSFTAKF